MKIFTSFFLFIIISITLQAEDLSLMATESATITKEIDWTKVPPGTTGILIRPEGLKNGGVIRNLGVFKLLRIDGTLVPEGPISFVFKDPLGWPIAWELILPDRSGKISILVNKDYMSQVRALSAQYPIMDSHPTMILEGFWIPRPVVGTKSILTIKHFSVVYDVYSFEQPFWEVGK